MGAGLAESSAIANSTAASSVAVAVPCGLGPACGVGGGVGARAQAPPCLRLRLLHCSPQRGCFLVSL